MKDFIRLLLRLIGAMGHGLRAVFMPGEYDDILKGKEEERGYDDPLHWKDW